MPWRRAPVLCFAKNHPYTLGFPGGSDSKESACDVRDLGSILGMQPAPVFLPGESPWAEEPGGLQSWGHKESDTTERLSTAQHPYT